MRATLQATPRTPATKGGIRRMRREGLVPVTVSAHGEETKEYSIPAKELVEIMRRAGGTALIELTGVGDGGKALVIPRDVQRDPVSHKLLHVGFQKVSARDRMTAEVPVVLAGQPEDARTGVGVLEHEATTVQVRCLPDKLPAHINVDTSRMEMGGVLHVSDIPASPDYEILSSPDTVLATLHTVRAAVTPQEEGQVTEEEVGTQAGQAAKE